MKALLSKLPKWAKGPLRLAKKVITAPLYNGRARFCPVCGRSSSRFKSYGIVPRGDAQCAKCGALERHRLLWLYLQKGTDVFDDKSKRMLHVAPEACFERRFEEQLGSRYLTADLLNPRAMVKMDICDIQYPDESFDVILCSHVLEHVLNDRQAMREICRVLSRSGWAILNVPVTRDKTYEDSSIVDPEERLKAFGQEDHVRHYGQDYVERLRESGFTVEIIRIEDVANSEESARMGLTKASGEIYFCTKSPDRS